MAAEPPIYVVVAQNDEERQRRNGATWIDTDGPLVFEQYTRTATLANANERAASIERRYGPCRVGRVIFEDHPAFKEST